MRAQLEIDLTNSAQLQLEEQKKKLKNSFETALKKIREENIQSKKVLLDQISSDEVFEKSENQKFSEQLNQLEIKSQEQIRQQIQDDEAIRDELYIKMDKER